MAGVECLETKTINFCKDSEYWAVHNVKQQKHQNERHTKNLQKP